MAGRSGASEEVYRTAKHLGLLGLTADQDLDEIMDRLMNLHPKYNTFPAEVLLEPAAEAIAEWGASPTEPIQCEGNRDRYLPEVSFRDKSQQLPSHCINPDDR